MKTIEINSKQVARFSYTDRSVDALRPFANMLYKYHFADCFLRNCDFDSAICSKKMLQTVLQKKLIVSFHSSSILKILIKMLKI